ncbi:RraA family protein [Frankia gtarii]|uniref:RraA family protein n=1 Tax=Frankia gtarii TaxID=2950102 RepID=UPI0021BE3931|nr:hypothetical protein [Frankia gtarii]
MSRSHESVAKLVAATGGTSTCTIVDVLDGLGLAESVLPPGLRARTDAVELTFGIAYTVSWVPVHKGGRIHDPSPSTWQQVREFLVPDVRDGHEMVYVAGAGDVLTHAALAGGMSLTYLLEQVGFKAAVLGGAVRDEAIVRALTRPVVASNAIPTDTQGSYRVAATGTQCRIGDVRIHTGDWVFIDGNGIVVVPDEHVEEVLRRAAEVERVEAEILARVRAGERLPEIVDAGGRI